MRMSLTSATGAGASFASLSWATRDRELVMTAAIVNSNFFIGGDDSLVFLGFLG